MTALSPSWIDVQLGCARRRFDHLSNRLQQTVVEWEVDRLEKLKAMRPEDALPTLSTWRGSLRRQYDSCRTPETTQSVSEQLAAVDRWMAAAGQ